MLGWMRYAVGAVLVILLMTTLGSPGSAEAPETQVYEDDAPACPQIALVEGLGPACRRDDGLLEVYDDTGELVATTHGHDPVPVDTHTSPPARHALRCTDPQYRPYHVLLIVAKPSDGGRVGITDDKMIELAEQANGAFLEGASRHGDYRSLYTRCNAADQPLIFHVTLPTPFAQTTFSTVAKDLRDLGFDDRRVKHWVWFDGRISCGCGGTGAIESDTSKSVSNDNNGNAGRIHASVTWGYHNWDIMAHELAHNLGAVQNFAPNASGGWHCNDGIDIMCYSDGGSRSAYSSNVCSAPERFDCNSDDYYHTEAPAGTYLARFWNLGDPHLRYLLGCFDATGFLDVGVPGIMISGRTYHDFDLPSCAPQEDFVLEAYPQPHGLVGITYDLEACFYQANGLRISCTTGLGHIEGGEVPANAAKVRVLADRGVKMHYSLRVG